MSSPSLLNSLRAIFSKQLSHAFSDDFRVRKVALFILYNEPFSELQIKEQVYYSRERQSSSPTKLPISRMFSFYDNGKSYISGRQFDKIWDCLELFVWLILVGSGDEPEKWPTLPSDVLICCGFLGGILRWSSKSSFNTRYTAYV